MPVAAETLQRIIFLFRGIVDKWFANVALTLSLSLENEVFLLHPVSSNSSLSLRAS